ncbi:MAG: MFS family permease [Acidimicrobiales bacterium]|jgi:MFS family permease
MKRTIALAALCVMVSHTLSRTAYQVMLTGIRDDLLGGSNQQAGLGATATFSGYMLGVAVMTKVAGRIEPLVALLTGLWVCGGAFLFLTVADQFWMLAAGLAMAGLGSAGIWLSVPAIATGAVSAEKRGTVMGFMSSSIGFGLVIVGQCVRVVRNISENDMAWRPIWAGASMFAFTVFALVVVFMRPEPTERADTKMNFQALRQVRGWVPLTLAYVLFGLMISGYSPFLGAKLTADGFSEAHVATLYSLIGVSAIFGAVSLGRISDKVGRKPVLIAAMAMMGLASLLVLPGAEPFASMSVILNGSSSFAFPVLVSATLRDHVSDRAFSNALGVLTLLYGVSLVLGPLAAGAIGDSALGFNFLYGAVATTSAVAVVLIWFVPGASSAARQ